MAPPDLSQVRDYYRRQFEQVGRRKEFERLFDEVRKDLLEAERYGADPGFLLHVLVCTKLRRVIRKAGSKHLQNLEPWQRASLAAGVRTILWDVGRAGLLEVFRSVEEPRAKELAESVWVGIRYVYRSMLVSETLKAPGMGIEHRGGKFSRSLADVTRTACIICLMEELKAHPKPAAATAVLLDKCGLLGRSRGGKAGISFVQKRFQRWPALAGERSVVGRWWKKQLKESYALIASRVQTD